MSKECILSILLKKLSKAIPPFDILQFDIRYSAVRFNCSFIGALPLAKITASLI
ncbi:hypothetical protein D1AOALGA4SA_7489 [Olavius algarvensis Delta 1 endosymbiont]|nr:hypothetical protein D1AOALGA4SA_7489 [Olavius algarvensis Delta 1 endosymbiont]